MRRLLAVTPLAVLTVLLVGGGLSSAAFTTHETNQQTFTAGEFPVPLPADLVAQSRTNDGGAAGTQVQYGLRLRNVGDGQVDLRTVTLRYWFTADGSSGEPIAACYYATFGCGQITQTVVDLPDLLEGADHYVQVAFTGGSLGAGQAATLEQLAFRDPAGAVYRQDNDHSFLARPDLTDNPRVTAYVDGQLVWGTEPQPVVPGVESVEVLYANLDADPLDNAIKPGLNLHNTGTEDIELRRLTLRYWFTAEGTSPLNGFCDYAVMGCNLVAKRFSRVSPARPGADAYLEVGFTGGTLDASTSTGQMQLRIHKADYSPFDENDDHSHDTNTSFATSVTVTAYLDGVLVWGAEP